MSIAQELKLVKKSSNVADAVFQVGNEVIGQELIIIAGPCSVETKESTLRIAKKIKELGVNFFRAGIFKPRSNPYAFQGLGLEGLNILREVKEQTGLKIVSEILDSESINPMIEVVDVFQVGSRNMHNSSLLKKLGTLDIPILLKRGWAATLEELLSAAEYIMMGGNKKVIICERGIRTFNTHCRNTLDVAAIAELRRLTSLPIIADPSHAAGKRELVESLCYAAIAAGAQGLIIEVHDEPEKAFSDGRQSIIPQDLEYIISNVKNISGAIVKFN